MGRIIQQNNGKTTVYTTGENFNNISTSANTYYVGVDVDGGYKLLSPVGSIDSFTGGGSFTGGTVSGATNFTNGLSATTFSATTYLNLPETGVINVTYSGLTTLINTSGLTIGNYYLITDFQTCYDQPDFDYNGNPILIGNYKESSVEAIMVFATGVNILSPDAYQAIYPNDKVKYDVTYSTTEVTGGVAYGRITERIDEFNNRTDYDHRTILFKRYINFEINFNNEFEGDVVVTTISANTMSISGTGTNFTSVTTGTYVGFDYADYKTYEVVSVISDTEMTISGLTSVDFSGKMYYADALGYDSFYQNNILTTDYVEDYTFDYNNFNVNNYIGNTTNLYQYEGYYFMLANNVFKGGSFTNNIFGDACYNNSFNDDCSNNAIGNYFFNNVTDDNFDSNVIANYFNNNSITANFQYNRIGERFNNNYIVQNSFYRNNIMNNFEGNVISGGDFQNNEIGNQFAYNKLRNQFYKNDIGNGFNDNKLYVDVYGNLIGNGFNNNNIYCQFYDNKVVDYFNNNNIGDITNLYSTTFASNILGNYFNGNNITGQNINNTIGDSFQYNTILTTFDDNKIGNQFKGNMIYDNFSLNTIFGYVVGNHFSGSTSGNYMGPYTMSNDFYGEVYGNTWKGYFYGNTIKDGFGGNVFLGEIYNNNIEYNFQYNKVGNYFHGNNIGNNFGLGFPSSQGNKISDNFYDNVIGNNFYNNTIPDNFYGNLIYNNFQWNIVETNINNVDFNEYFNNITGFTYTSTGSTASGYIYSSLTGVTTGFGVEATFDVVITAGTVFSIIINNIGKFYQGGDLITILGSQIGGTDGTDNIVVTVTGVTQTPSVYESYTCKIFERRLGDKRLSYYDEFDVLTITDVNE